MAEASMTVGSRDKLGPRDLPREHGFWTMLAAVLLSAVLRRASAEVLVAAAAVAAVSIVGASLLGPSIRRHPSAQVLSSAALGLLGLPLDWVSGRALVPAVLTALAWVTIFAASALAVRGIFASASPRRRRNAGPLAFHSPRLLFASAVLLPVVPALLFQTLGARAELVAGIVAAVLIGGIAWQRPSVKQLKPVGLTLAALHAASAMLLGGLFG